MFRLDSVFLSFHVCKYRGRKYGDAQAEATCAATDSCLVRPPPQTRVRPLPFSSFSNLYILHLVPFIFFFPPPARFPSSPTLLSFPAWLPPASLFISILRSSSSSLCPSLHSFIRSSLRSSSSPSSRLSSVQLRGNPGRQPDLELTGDMR